MHTILRQPRLLGLLLCSVSTLFVGMSLFPLFPHYAAGLGAGPGAVGAALAVIYLASTIGPLATRLVARRISRRLLFIAAGCLGPPSIALLGQATALWQAVALMSVAWFCGGIILTLVSVFTSIYADVAVRARAFAVVSLAPPLGGLLGGAATGALLSRFDFAAACLVLGAVWVILPLVGALTLDVRAERGRMATPPPTRGGAAGGAFGLVLGASLLAHIAISAGRLGGSLLMQTQALTAAAVATTAAVSGLASIPLILLCGALGDRVGRRAAFVLACALAAAGAALHLGATAPWHFWVAATLLLTAYCAAGALAGALTADTVAPAALGGAMARLSAVGSLASVLSFAGTGYLYDLAGPGALFGAAALLGVGAAAAVLRLGTGGRAPAATPALASGD
ncbi:MAG TPA: hypothetical protein PKD53_08130 [Chloroflexaceae bacterium]|nr:hypothetical protein [Chloroflexaceae bacterium]